MLAKISGLFRLTRDAELKITASGVPVLKLGLVCSEKFKERETTLFMDATAFNKPAEILNQYAGQKGTQIYLTGKLQTESWTAQDGQNRSKVSMVIEGFDFVSNKSNNSQPNQGHQQQQPQIQQMQAQSYRQPQTQQQPQQSYQRPSYNNNQAQTQNRQMPNAASIPEIDIDENEIPF